MPQHFTPQVLVQTTSVSGGSNAFKEGAVQMLSHAVELWCIMDSQMSCRSCCSQVFIEHITEVLTSSVRTKDLDCLTMLLHLHSCLEMLVSIKSLCLGVEISDCVLSSIVGKCNEILATVLARD